MHAWILVITMFGNPSIITQMELSSQTTCIKAGNKYIDTHPIMYQAKKFDLYCQEK